MPSPETVHQSAERRPGIAMIETSIEAWNRGDLDGYFGHFRADVVYQGLGSNIEGVAALRAHYSAFRTAMPDHTIRIVRATGDASGRYVAGEFVESGTHTEDLITPEGTLPATGRRVEAAIAVFCELDDDGLVAVMREYSDRSSLQQQLAGQDETTSNQH